MHRDKRYMLVFSFIILLVCMGCSTDKENEPLPTSKRFAELYPEDLTLIDRIDIRSGSTGEKRTVTDPAVVREWAETVRDIVLVPDSNQEGYVGFLYSVQLFSGERKTLYFTVHYINNITYLDNPAFTDSIRTLFMEHSTRADHQ